MTEESNPESRQGRPRALTLGRSIAGVGALLVIAMFFAPWQGAYYFFGEVPPGTGFELAIRYPTYFILAISPLVGAFVIAVLVTALGKPPRDTKVRVFVNAVLGIVGVALMMTFYAGPFHVDVYYGVPGSVIGHLGIVVGSIIDLVQGLRSERRS